MSEGTQQSAGYGWAILGALIQSRRLERRWSQAKLAEVLGEQLGRPVPQSKVSRNEEGREWTSFDLVVAYCEVLGLDLNSAAEIAMGRPVQRPSVDTISFAEKVRSDDTLSDASKDHLINQYGLLQQASAFSRRATDTGLPDLVTEEEKAKIENDPRLAPREDQPGEGTASA